MGSQIQIRSINYVSESVCGLCTVPQLLSQIRFSHLNGWVSRRKWREDILALSTAGVASTYVSAA